MSIHKNEIKTNVPVHRFFDTTLTEGFDYEIDETDGTYVKGYGENPHDVKVLGVSVFDPEPVPEGGHGGVDSRTQLDAQCTVLLSHPPELKLAQDYITELRFRDKKQKKQKQIKHYSIFPVERVPLHEFRQLLYASVPTSCQWGICNIKDEGQKKSTFVFDDGCDLSDLNNLNDFAIRALYQFAKFVFPRLKMNDKIIINGLLTLLSKQIMRFDEFLVSTPLSFLWTVYQILSKETDLPQSVANFAGITLGKLEDFLYMEETVDQGDRSELNFD